MDLDSVIDRLANHVRCDLQIGLVNRSAHRGIGAVSVELPLELGDRYADRKQHWWPILSDLVPQGFARQYYYRKLGIGLERAFDEVALLVGAMNQPGHLRVCIDSEEQLIVRGLTAQHARQVTEEHQRLRERRARSGHQGFEKEEIAQRGTDFIEYCQQMGTPGTGATGAQGDAPKYLLREDRHGRFHADGDLSDSETKAAWLVKYPAAATPVQTEILKAEAVNLRLAEYLGLNVFSASKLHWVSPSPEESALFIPRFDRVAQEAEGSFKLKYCGLESMASALSISAFGTISAQQDICRCILEVSTQPACDLLEYLKRDLLNFLCLNTDNHTRNSAFLKDTDGSICLAPLYDFAPMALDPRGIARLNRFESERLSASLLPDYRVEIEQLFQNPPLLSRFSEPPDLRSVREWIESGLVSFMHDLAQIDLYAWNESQEHRYPERVLRRICAALDRRRGALRGV